MAHVGLSLDPRGSPKKPLDLTRFQFENRSRTTRCRFLQQFALPGEAVELQLLWGNVGGSVLRANTTQHNTTQHNTTQHNTTQHNTTQHSTAQHSTAQHSTAQHSTAQHSTAQQDKTRQDKTRQDKTRQDKTRQDKTRQVQIHLQCVSIRRRLVVHTLTFHDAHYSSPRCFSLHCPLPATQKQFNT